MSRLRICDICKKPADIGMKVYLVPLKEGDPAVKTTFNNYTHSMDVGVCCIDIVNRFGKWTKRKSRPGSGWQNKPKKKVEAKP